MSDIILSWVLPDPNRERSVDPLYCVVPDTYDERMFHQLVARNRWHGVLLGKPALRLTAVDADAPILHRKRLQKLRLDLSP